MNALLNRRNIGVTPHSYSIGYSSEAKEIEHYHIAEDAESSSSINSMDQQLSILNLYDCCSKDNWDGDGEKAITPDVWRGAVRLIASLLPGIPKPEITASPDGKIVLEWYRCKSNILAITIVGEYKLHFNALFGEAEAYGLEPFQDDMPVSILDNMARLYRI